MLTLDRKGKISQHLFSNIGQSITSRLRDSLPYNMKCWNNGKWRKILGFYQKEGVEKTRWQLSGLSLSLPLDSRVSLEKYPLSEQKSWLSSSNNIWSLLCSSMYIGSHRHCVTCGSSRNWFGIVPFIALSILHLEAFKELLCRIILLLLHIAYNCLPPSDLFSNSETFVNK